MRTITSILIFLVVIPPGVGTGAEEKGPSLPIDKAVQLVQSPATGFANMSPFELQVQYRLSTLLYQARYRFEKSHASAWRALMLDEKKNIYARLCAAYFLLDGDKQSRDFIMQQVRSKDLRHRYNAAETVRLHLATATVKFWDVDLLITLLSDGSLDGSDVHESPRGQYPDGDRDDIMASPIDDISRLLGFMKEKKAVNALISVLERHPNTAGAADALGQIGDGRAIPVLLKILRDGNGNNDEIVVALGQLKSREAVPILMDRLGQPSSRGADFDDIETADLLGALLAVGDKRAIPAIEQYLKAKNSAESTSVAKRVLVQLKSADPATDLLALFNAETNESERSDIIWALVKYPNRRVITELSQLARMSDSAFIRREAILALRDMKTREALLQLVDLINVRFPKELKAEFGWKGPPPDFSVFFPQLVIDSLKQTTGQNYGSDGRKWATWINEHLQNTEKAPPPNR